MTSTARQVLNNLKISELELIDKSKVELKETIEKLHVLKENLRQLNPSETSDEYGVNLIHEIDRDIELYTHFANQSRTTYSPFCDLIYNLYVLELDLTHLLEKTMNLSEIQKFILDQTNQVQDDRLNDVQSVILI